MTRNEAIITVLAGLAANRNFNPMAFNIPEREADEKRLVERAYRLVNEAELRGVQFHSGNGGTR